MGLFVAFSRQLFRREELPATRELSHFSSGTRVVNSASHYSHKLCGNSEHQSSVYLVDFFVSTVSCNRLRRPKITRQLAFKWLEKGATRLVAVTWLHSRFSGYRPPPSHRACGFQSQTITRRSFGMYSSDSLKSRRTRNLISSVAHASGYYLKQRTHVSPPPFGQLK